MEVERVAVAGGSMGGFVAQELAARAPQRVERLILLATDGGGPEAVPASDPVWDRLTDHSGTPRDQASRLIALLFPPSVAPAIDERFGDLVAAARRSLRPATLRAQERAMQAWHREPADRRLAAIEAPVLIACGTEDVVIPPANSGLLAAALAGARLERFGGGGHAFMAQEPQRLAALITTTGARQLRGRLRRR
jgi:pimeloyl-ACP methyl ester carboxylesterase